MLPPESTEIRSRVTLEQADKHTCAMFLMCGTILCVLFSSRAAAQCLAANSAGVQSTLRFECELRVTAQVPSFVASRSLHDAILTIARSSAAPKAAGNTSLIAHAAVLTTSFVSDSASLARASAFDLASFMLSHATVQVSITLPQNAIAPDQRNSSVVELAVEATDQSMDFNNDGSIDFFDYLDVILEHNTSVSGSDQTANTP